MRISTTLAAVVALALGPGTEASASSVTGSLTEVGGDLVLSYSGTVDLAGLPSPAGSGDNGGLIIWPSGGRIVTGVEYDLYLVLVSGPNFGSGSYFSQTGVSSGASFGVSVTDNLLYVPQGYVSNAPLSGSSTVAGTSLSDVGAAEGVYAYSFGSNTFTLTVGDGAAVVPLPASLPLALAALGGLALLRLRRRT